MLFLPMLYFPRHLLTRQMVEATLEELVIYYPFSAMCLPLWLVLPSASLRGLVPRVDFDMSSVASSGWIRVPRLDRRRAKP
ncbi:Os11g0498500 [Oryza sativa Japonica Group]|uniref:Os11g0498500 protein n=1 Tax=Oryza sativa subsp. japonica TaxID=39947 RepID=A0A0P0Y2F8_ORYSJ|nr:Os11g0498500 [Oryza sativa Japonica Group]